MNLQIFKAREELGKVAVGISTALLLLVEVAGIVLLGLTGILDQAVILGLDQNELASLVTVKVPAAIAVLRGLQAIFDKIAVAVASRPVVTTPSGTQVVLAPGDTSQVVGGTEPATGNVDVVPSPAVPADMGDAGPDSMPQG